MRRTVPALSATATVPATAPATDHPRVLGRFGTAAAIA
jgi:hypothetical protein